MFFITVFQHLTMCMQAGIFGQQRRVDIQQAFGIVGDKRRAEDTHIPGQYHDVRRIGIDLLY
ncbi:hypothetical protein D3C73_1429010 [compost metagenome]